MAEKEQDKTEEKVNDQENVESIETGPQLHTKENKQEQKEFDQFKNEQKRINRTTERLLGNQLGSLVVKEDGTVSINNKYGSLSVYPNGAIESRSLINITTTNRVAFETDDFMINGHKLNNKLYELADFKRINHSEIDEEEVNIKSGIGGHFCMFGTVLVKAWDHKLNKYMLIRRLVNIPMFSPELNR